MATSLTQKVQATYKTGPYEIHQLKQDSPDQPKYRVDISLGLWHDSSRDDPKMALFDAMLLQYAHLCSTMEKQYGVSCWLPQENPWDEQPWPPTYPVPQS